MADTQTPATAMRGVYTNLTEIRRRVFREVAKLAYSNTTDSVVFRNLPYEMIEGETAEYRESIFLERAIIAERIRLAMGLPYQSPDKPTDMAEGLEQAAKPETYYEPPLINIIKFACNACEDKVFRVADSCQGCLAHPCMEVCPKGAISFRHGRAFIDQEKCIKCGRCNVVCPFHAIHRYRRPCADACGMHCIGSDENGRADIDYEKCVSCGQCLASCPFGAIADKSQIYQVIQAINNGEEVIAAVAPAWLGQYGGKGNVGRLRQVFNILGFSGVEEVAIGADLCAVEEADDFLEEVVYTDHLPFLATSCCPAWASMAKMEFPEHAKCISMALTPMTLTARMIRTHHPHAKIVFVGPCSAKKLEAMRTSVRSEVDFVLTFEELAGMMEAKEISYLELEDDPTTLFEEASGDGRSFAVSGGVANAVLNVLSDIAPDLKVNVEAAEGLDECREMMKRAAKGEFPGYLLEGMACPGGCVAGPGTLAPINKSAALVRAYSKKAPHEHALANSYRYLIKLLEREEDGKKPEELAEEQGK